jgi:hypothetical protein
MLRAPSLAVIAVVFLSTGAPAAEPESPFSAEERSHWSFQPVRRHAPPTVKQSAWVKTPIDAFLLARLEAKGLAPAVEANRRALIRRAMYDLHGLPPTPAEVEAFVNDQRTDAYERLIDRLLQSPRYGERWARHWLDLAHYAESDGYKSDVMRPGAWKYRDYVIRSLNVDKPYDRFVSEQLAGDEIAPNDGDAQIATGFLRQWPYEDNGRDLDRQWAAILSDVTETTGQVFLGMTIGCAKCHDHKFDPLLQRDYYRLQAFFAAMVPSDDLPVGKNAELDEYHAKMRNWEAATAKLRAERDRLASPFFQKAQRGMGSQFPPHLQAILDKPDEDRTPYEKQLVTLAGKMLRVDRKKMAGRMKGDVRKRWDELTKELAAFDKLRPKNLSVARGVRDIGSEASPTTIPGEDAKDVIAPGFLSVLDPADAKITPVSLTSKSTGRRATLARWIIDPKNPLTARVAVNRLWQHHFGVGIVASSGDFGTQGDDPTHPQLLDWLASEFVQQGWSLKAMHRLMMTSAAYRQTALRDPDATIRKIDPANNLLWRMRSQRLEAEVMRDAMLAVSGELSLKMFGESVLPELPKGLSARYGWKPTPGADQQNRRSIYLVVRRNAQLPLLSTFDVPDSHHTCTRRARTTTPTQALILLNDGWPLKRAQALAGRVLKEAGGSDSEVIRRAYEIVYTRLPEAEELAAGEKFLKRQAGIIAERIKKKEKIAEPTSLPKDYNKARGAALVDYCHALLNSNEFVYVD